VPWQLISRSQSQYPKIRGEVEGTLTTALIAPNSSDLTRSFQKFSKWAITYDSKQHYLTTTPVCKAAIINCPTTACKKRLGVGQECSEKRLILRTTTLKTLEL
jgi:hypothetical protein